MKYKPKNTIWKFSLFFSLVVAILVFACRKIDSYQPSSVDKATKFFTISPNVNPTVQRVANELKKQNALTGFINNFATKHGYAVWDKAIVKSPNKARKKTSANSKTATEAADTLVLIPLVEENTDYVNSFIAAKVSDNVLVKLYEGNRYDEEPFYAVTPTDSVTAEKYALQLMLFDNYIFGRTKFKLTDDRLFQDLAPMQANSRYRILEIKNRAVTGQSLRMVTEIVTICILINHCPYQNPPHCTGGPHGECDNCEASCATTTCLDFQVDTWYDDDWGGGGGSGGGDGGGGGPSGNPQNPCNGNGVLISNGRLACSGGSGGGLGWEPIPIDNTNFEELPNWINDSLPTTCFKSALQKISGGPQNTFFKEIYNIFDTSSSLFLDIKEVDSIAGAYAHTYPPYLSSFGQYIQIEINKKDLRKCSQEYISYVLMHEVIHAAMFVNVIAWDSTNSQHENMISTYLDKMATSLTSSYPNLSLLNAYSICYWSFNNAIDGNVPSPILLSIMLSKIKAKLNNPALTVNQLIQNGEKYTDLGTSGSRLCK
jgi:hypothetical protein